MKYEIEMNYRYNIPEQSYLKKKPVFAILVKLRSQIIALYEPDSKIVQLNKIQKKIGFNNLILIFSSLKTQTAVKVDHAERRPHHRGLISILHV